MKSPRLEMLKYLYNRPSVSEALGECLKDFMRCENGGVTAEQLVRLSRQDYDRIKEDRNST